MTGVPCPDCPEGGEMVGRFNKKGKIFYGCSAYPKPQVRHQRQTFKGALPGVRQAAHRSRQGRALHQLQIQGQEGGIDRMQEAVLGYVERFVDYLEAEKHASRLHRAQLQERPHRQPAARYGKGLFQFLDSHGITSLEAVDKRIMREYLGYLVDQRVAKVSLARKLSAIRSFYSYLLREHIIERNPTELTVSPKLERRLPEFLTTEETLKLIKIPDVSKPHGQRDRAIIELSTPQVYASASCLNSSSDRLNWTRARYVCWARATRRGWSSSASQQPERWRPI